MKREHLFAVSTGPMRMFRLEHKTMTVCQRNVARFVHMECRFDKITAVIYCYIMTKFHYVKHDSRHSAYGGVGIEVSYFW